MREACEHLFGPAAPHMFEFYRVLERTMFETPYFHQNWNLPPAHKVYTEAVVEEADSHIRAAMEINIDDTAIRERIEAEIHDWEQSVELLAGYRQGPPRRWKVYYDDQYMFWHEPEMTVGRIRSLIGLPNHFPLFAVTPEGDVSEPEPSETMDLTSAVKFYSERP